jgi:hypothetical protein
MSDSLPERGEFELPVPICEQSDDSIRLSFATSRRTAKRLSPCSAFLVHLLTVEKDPRLILLFSASGI